jgi:hypothetical protein
MPENKLTLDKVIKEINSDAQFTYWGEDFDSSIDGIRWDNGTTPISKEDILAKKSEMENGG